LVEKIAISSEKSTALFKLVIFKLGTKVVALMGLIVQSEASLGIGFNCKYNI